MKKIYLLVAAVLLAVGLIFVTLALLSKSGANAPEIPNGRPKGGDKPLEGSDILSLHNSYRKKANAPPLSWSKELERGAQAWADYLRANEGCAMRHPSSEQERNQYLGGNTWGQNLMSATRGSAEMAVNGWGPAECPSYSPDAQGVQGTGHFSQMVWKSTSEVGCAKASCPGSSIWVCNYSPAGNVRQMGGGDEFALYRKNVEKPC